MYKGRSEVIRLYSQNKIKPGIYKGAVVGTDLGL